MGVKRLTLPIGTSVMTSRVDRADTGRASFFREGRISVKVPGILQLLRRDIRSPDQHRLTGERKTGSEVRE